MANRKHLLHVKSNVVEKAKQYGINDFLVTPKKPVDPSTGKATDDTLLYGEIAVNYGKGVEALIIRNTENNVVTFVNENDFHEAGEIIADGMATEKLEREEADAAETAAREAADTAEKLAREAADATETAAREAADATEQSERKAADATEKSAREAADAAETAARKDADAAEKSAREAADATEQSERKAADAAETAAREESELVAANAFVYLDEKIDTSVISKMVSITYDEIKVLREQSKLKPGQFYRITDYVTTTTQENTQSAGHVFDVIVLATDVDTLNENAKAIKHEGDTYFANSDLDAWEIKYDLDNDITKYAWADETNGKGVIFYMKDEWNNECPYDFKNIQFKRWAITEITSNTLSIDTLQALNNTFNFNDNGRKHFANKDMEGNWLPNSQKLTVTVDESNFGWYYTFNGMSSEDGTTKSNIYDLSTNQFKLSDECLNYFEETTFVGSDTTERCYDNKISLSTDEYFVDDAYNKGRIVLNNIVFNNGLSYCYYDGECWVSKTSSCYRNTFGNNCYSNTFGNNCYSNTFGNTCSTNTFGYDYQSNTFGNNCYSNFFGDGCYNNTFGNSCSTNTFGNGCHSNTFGNGCHQIIFERSCHSNTFGNNCYNNTFGDKCYSNFFGDGCYNNTFGNSCYANTFGDNNDNNTFGNNCYYNVLENSDSTNTFGSNVQRIRFEKDYMYYNIVENGNKYITVTSTETTSSNQLLRNFTIAQGVNSNALNEQQRKTISHNTVNDTFKTTYQNANSKTVNV